MESRNLLITQAAKQDASLHVQGMRRMLTIDNMKGVAKQTNKAAPARKLYPYAAEGLCAGANNATSAPGRHSGSSNAQQSLFSHGAQVRARTSTRDDASFWRTCCWRLNSGRSPRSGRERCKCIAAMYRPLQ